MNKEEDFCQFEFEITMNSNGKKKSKNKFPDLLLVIVSQGNTHLPPSHIQQTPNKGLCRSVGFGSSFLIWVVVSTILTTPPYIPCGM